MPLPQRKPLRCRFGTLFNETDTLLIYIISYDKAGRCILSSEKRGVVFHSETNESDREQGGPIREKKERNRTALQRPVEGDRSPAREGWTAPRAALRDGHISPLAIARHVITERSEESLVCSTAGAEESVAGQIGRTHRHGPAPPGRWDLRSIPGWFRLGLRGLARPALFGIRTQDPCSDGETSHMRLAGTSLQSRICRSSGHLTS